MLLASRFAAAATALFLFSTVGSPAEAASGDCADAAELTVLPSPIAPWKGAPLRVMVVAEKPLEGVLSLIAPDGSVAAKSPDRHGGPPYSWFAEVAAPAAGTWHATLALDHATADCSAITRDITVSARKPEPLRTPSGSILAGAKQLEQHERSPVLGVDREAVRRAARPGSVLEGRGTKCCATNRAISCSTISDATKTIRKPAFAPTAPTSSTSCAPILPTRWGCRSAIRIARAASAASRRSATSGSTSSIPRSRVRRRRPNRKSRRPTPAAAPPPRRRRRLLGLFGRSQPPAEHAAQRRPAKAPPPKPKRPTNFGEYLRDVGDVVHTGAVRVAGRRQHRFLHRRR